MKEKISFKEFLEISNKLEIVTCEIVDAKRVEGKDRLLQLTISDGKKEYQSVTNIGDVFDPEDIIGIICPFILNLEPSKIAGIKSEAMIMALSIKDLNDKNLTFLLKASIEGAKVFE
jgi:tRNA-binding EMAP/Myf-like protein